MEKILAQETENLQESWRNNDPGMMEEYLVTGFENPRLNMQSILTRHFFIRELFGNQFDDLMEEEMRFSVEIHRALKQEEKRVEAEVSPEMKKRPRYIRWKEVEQVVPGEKWDSFITKWSAALTGRKAAKLKVLELACGSANDYRFLHAYGIAQYLDYTGMDLAETNIRNAQKMFPHVDFRIGNAMAVAARDGEYDYLLVSDLLEHLSPMGLETAAGEICRVTAGKLLVHFFSMQDIPEHKINPIRNYFWNWLSRTKTRRLFEKWCKKIDIIWIREFLTLAYNYPEYYNKNSHTFFMEK
ncbi:MAG: class I SAM-dependent methyltransferase [bacterium]|nr:class I SAM-dependent methyltransferase [bacterium]